MTPAIAPLFPAPPSYFRERERFTAFFHKSCDGSQTVDNLSCESGAGCWGCTDALLSPPQCPHHSGFLLEPQVSGCGPGRKAGKTHAHAASFHGHPPLSEVFLEEQAFLRRVAGKCVCVFLLLKVLSIIFLPFLKLSSDSPSRSLFPEPVVTKQPCP